MAKSEIYSDEQAEQVYTEFVNKYWVDEATNLSITLTGHLFIEKRVDDLIQITMPFPDKVLKYRFAQKVEILHASGNLPLRSYKMIKIINIIRNNYAHDLDYEIDRKLAILLNSLRRNPVPNIRKIDTSELFIKSLCYTMGLIHGNSRTHDKPTKTDTD